MPLFITALSLFIPIIMIVFGILMWFAPPKGRNTSYGYRTKRSMMNEETWDYAQACLPIPSREDDWWFQMDLNQRYEKFQLSALPD